MKTILQTLFLIASGYAALAQTQLVVPGGLDNMEGNSSSSGPFAVGSSRFQQIYSASEFASLGVPTELITGVSFRLDAAAPERTLASWQGVGIFLFTTSRSPDDLSSVFDDNSGPDSTLVFAGSLGKLATITPGVEPQPFSFHIPFTGSFYYVPSRGNLGMEITLGGGTGNLMLDAQLATGDGAGSVFADTFNTSSGQVDSLGLITRFDVVPIPEPSCGSLMLLAALSFGFMGGLKWWWAFLRSSPKDWSTPR